MHSSMKRAAMKVGKCAGAHVNYSAVSGRSRSITVDGPGGGQRCGVVMSGAPIKRREADVCARTAIAASDSNNIGLGAT